MNIWKLTYENNVAIGKLTKFSNSVIMFAINFLIKYQSLGHGLMSLTAVEL